MTVSPSGTVTIMYTLLLVMIVISVIDKVHPLSEIVMTMQPSPGPVWLGDQVNFTCIPKNFSNRTKAMSVMFRKSNSVFISDGCMSYKSQYKLICEPPGWEAAQMFHFTILNVSWADHGSWFCAISLNVSEKFLEVYVMGQLRPMKADLLLPDEAGSTKDASSSSSMGQQLSSPSVYLTNQNRTVTQHYRIIPLSGQGIADSPYNLKPNAGKTVLKITCHVTCSNPPTRFLWTIKNGSTSVELSPISVERSSECDAGLTSQEEYVLVNCSTLGLEGLTEVSCEAKGKQYQGEEAAARRRRDGMLDPLSRSVFVLCPAAPSRFRLTQGEMVAICVGAVLALVLLLLGCCVCKQHARDTQQYKERRDSGAQRHLVAGVHV